MLASSVPSCCLEIPYFAISVCINIQGQDAVLSVEMAYPVHVMEKKKGPSSGFIDTYDFFVNLILNQGEDQLKA